MKKLFTCILASSLFLVSCTKSGSLSGASAGGGSFSGLSGSVNGGLSPVSGALVSLFATGNSTALATATTTSTGAFTINFTNPGGSSLLYLLATGGNAGSGTNSKIQLGAVLGLTSNTPTSIVLNEATTGALFNIAYNYGGVKDSNGTVTFPAVNSAANTSMIAQYNNLVTNGSMNGSLSTANQNILGTMANAVAACVENASNCSTLFSNAINGSGSSAISIQDALYNIVNATATVTSLYTLATPFASTTGFSMPGSNQTVLNVPPIVTTQTFPAGSGPRGIAVDASGNLWIADLGGNVVTQLNSSGTTLGSFSVGNAPYGIAIDASGNVWVENNGVDSVTKLNSAGAVLGTFSGVGISNGQDIMIDASGNVWIPNFSGNNVTELNNSGTLVGNFAVGTQPIGIAFDGSGNFWVTNSGGNNVTRLNSSGSASGTFSVGTTPSGIVIDNSGNLWIGNSGANNVTKLNSSGTTLGTFSAGTGAGVHGLAVDAGGNLWVANTSSNNLTKLNPSGVSLGTYSIGAVARGLLIDASGNIWVNSATTNVVTKIPGVTLGPEFFPYTGPVFPSAQF